MTYIAAGLRHRSVLFLFWAIYIHGLENETLGGDDPGKPKSIVLIILTKVRHCFFRPPPSTIDYSLEYRATTPPPPPPKKNARQ